MDSSGSLYGTTLDGGSAGNGTVFKIDSAGNKSVLHSFNVTDGGYVIAGLIMDASGNLYGTTFLGGSAYSGTVFKIDAGGNEIVIYNFTGGTDGANPNGGLILDASGNLYGTTTAGGSAGMGTVFKIDATDKESVIHSFNGTDGQSPSGSLVLDASGNLFGTTIAGGSAGFGTVFKINAAGDESVLHSFTGADGQSPSGGLVRDASGNLYGTTQQGGSAGIGTVFKIDATGNETVLYSFNGADGQYPNGSLVLDAYGNLYGTTQQGGSAGYGTVFKITPASSPSITSVSPLSAAPGQTLDLVINGSGFQSASTLSFSGTGITVNSYSSQTATQLVANISIASDAAIGTCDVIVTNPDSKQATLSAGFEIIASPVIGVSPMQLYFVAIPLRTTSSAVPVTIKNTGTQSLQISSITTQSPFAVVSPIPTSIPPGGQATVSVTFRPVSTDPSTGTLKILSNASNRSEIDIPLSGSFYISTATLKGAATHVYIAGKGGTIADLGIKASGNRTEFKYITETACDHIYDVAGTADGNYVYATCSSVQFGNRIHVVDTSTDEVTATISTSGVPTKLAINASDNRLAIATSNGTDVYDISVTASGRSSHYLGSILPGTDCSSVAFSIKSALAITTQSSLEIYDASTLGKIGSVDLPTTPTHVFFAPDGTKIYVLLASSIIINGDSGPTSGNLAVFYTNTLAAKTAVQPFGFGGRLDWGLVANGRAYVTSQVAEGGSLYSIDLTLDQEVSETDIHNAFGLAARGGDLYVGDPTGSAIYDVELGKTPLLDQIDIAYQLLQGTEPLGLTVVERRKK